MARFVFWLLIALNTAGLGLWLLLGLAAAKPSHTPLLHVLAFFAVPAGGLVGLTVLYTKAPWPWAPAAATVGAAAPLVLLLGGAALSGLWTWRTGESAAPTSSPPAASRAVPAPQQLEAALRASRSTGTEPVLALLHAGAVPDQRGDSAPAWFSALAASADPQVLPLLLDRGVDLAAVDAAGRNAVQVALLQRRWEAAALLIERGAAWQHIQLTNGQTVPQLAATELRRPGVSKSESEALARLTRASAEHR